MSDEQALVIRETDALTPEYVKAEREHYRYLMGLGRAIYESGLAPKAHTDARQTAIVMLVGRELGLQPMASIRSIYVVNGKPAMSAELMVALVRQRGLGTFDYTIEEGSVSVLGMRTASGETIKSTWDRERAARAGLDSKDIWRKYESEMLRHRAEAEVCRALFGDILLSMYITEELDEEPTPAPEEEPESRTEAIKKQLADGMVKLPEPPMPETELPPGVLEKEQAPGPPDESLVSPLEEETPKEQVPAVKARPGRAPGATWIALVRVLGIPEDKAVIAAKGCRMLDAKSRPKLRAAYEEHGRDTFRMAFDDPEIANMVLTAIGVSLEEEEEAEPEVSPAREAPSAQPPEQPEARAKGYTLLTEARLELDRLYTVDPDNFSKAIDELEVDLKDGIDGIDIDMAQKLLKRINALRLGEGA